MPLKGILLITRSRPGPKLIYHYPGVIDTQDDIPDRDNSPHSETSTDARSSQDEGRHVSQSGYPRSASTKATHGEPDPIQGLKADLLERLLSPGRWCDRKKFAITVDGWTFVGHPIYAYENGEWSKRAAKERPQPSNRQDTQYYDYLPYETGSEAHVVITAPDAPSNPPNRSQHAPDSFDTHTGLSLGTSMESASTMSEMAPEELTMFHVVFVMTREETSRSTDLLYQNVVKTLGEAMRFCQIIDKHYVASQARRISSARSRLGMNADASALALRIAEHSELAWAMKSAFESASFPNGSVPSVKLNGHSLSLRYDAAGDSNAGDAEADVPVGPHAALLLLETKETMLRELTHPDAAPLAYFVKEHTATKSLQKHAIALAVPISDVLFMARHLVKWKKARTVTPLHPRNTYVCNPDFPTSEIEHHVPVFARMFAALPPLPALLKMLSGKPVQFGLLIPTRDHRQPYMEMLTYLVQYRFVMQLSTIAWLRLPQALLIDAPPSPMTSDSTANRSASLASILSSALQSEDEDSYSQTSDRTAVPWLGRRVSQPELARGGSHASQTQGDLADVIVRDPSNLTDREARAVAAMLERLPDAFSRDDFAVILPHLDGMCTLEEIHLAAKEGIKRSSVESCLTQLEKMGYLLAIRAL